MAERRVQLNADEENKLFQEAKTNNNSSTQHDHDHDSGDESNEESGVVQRGIPNGEEPEAPNSGTFFLGDIDRIFPIRYEKRISFVHTGCNLT
jgi:hypothetical protein